MFMWGENAENPAFVGERPAILCQCQTSGYRGIKN